jgi:uracil-DNA glycosylase
VSWSDRQQQMLREMGLVVWQSAVAAEAPAAATSPTMPAAAAPAVAPDAAPLRQAEPAARAPRVEEPRPKPVTAAARPAAPLDDDRSRHVATLDWPALRDAVADCRACGLCGTRTQTVFGVGHLQARWMIIGEAPGEQEDLQGQPFVGPSGELLDSMLRALKLTRSSEGPEGPGQRVYIANTLKCRPPRNRNPEPAELLACEPFLIRQIALIKPQLILAMGRFAVQALLRSNDPVGKLRGQVHSYQGVPLVVTYHPAYLLRNLADKARAWDDLCLAASVAERG